MWKRKWNKYQEVSKLNRYYCNQCFMKTPECQEKMRLNHADFSGKNHPRYDFNISDYERTQRKRKIPGYSTFLKKVLKRDNHTCQKCKSTINLNVHHIKNYKHFKKLRLDINNGITLCFDCHGAANGKSIHSVYGMFPNDKQFTLFMSK